MKTSQVGPFSELKPPLTEDEAFAESSRCLFCYDAPCTRVCPTEIDVPAFIKKIETGNLRGAAKTILSANILGASCARVCPTEELCEGACVLHDLQKQPIDIGRLQRYATDPYVLSGTQLFTAGPSQGKSIAVIGAGPSGLSCAATLVQRGYDVTVYDDREKPGGLNSFGVADYKMDHATALKEVEWIEALGVKIVRQTKVGKDVTIETLLAENDALFIGVGLGKIPYLGIPGEDLDGVLDTLDFVEALKITPKEDLSLAGRTVAVLGGGNTAIDGVTQSVRLGAEQVYLVYRREEEAMPAYDHEIELARLDGVDFIFSASPVALEGEGKVERLRCIMTQATTDDPRGPLEELADSEFDLSVDLVLRATGQQKRTEFLSTIADVKLDKKGRIVVDDNGRTQNEKVWAGGDCVNGGKEVVNAVAAGRDAAFDIDRVLTHGEG